VDPFFSHKVLLLSVRFEKIVGEILNEFPSYANELGKLLAHELGVSPRKEHSSLRGQ
jgi:hypothetical protein